MIFHDFLIAGEEELAAAAAARELALANGGVVDAARLGKYSHRIVHWFHLLFHRQTTTGLYYFDSDSIFVVLIIFHIMLFKKKMYNFIGGNNKDYFCVA